MGYKNFQVFIKSFLGFWRASRFTKLISLRRRRRLLLFGSYKLLYTWSNVETNENTSACECLFICVRKFALSIWHTPEKNPFWMTSKRSGFDAINSIAFCSWIDFRLCRFSLIFIPKSVAYSPKTDRLYFGDILWFENSRKQPTHWSELSMTTCHWSFSQSH